MLIAQLNTFRLSMLLSALVSISRAVVLFIINKAVATSFGPSGIAAMSQIQYALATAQALGGKSLQNGIIRYTKDSSPENGANHLGAALSISTAGALLSSACLIGFQLLSPPDLVSSAFTVWVYGIVPFSIFSSSATTIWLAFRQGQRRYIRWFLISFGGLAVQAGTLLSLIQFKDIDGLIAALFLFPILQCALCLFDIVPRGIFSYFARTTVSAIQELKPFLIAGIVSIGLSPLVQIALLSRVASTSGILEAGLWQGTVRLSDIALGLVSTTLATWYLPAINHAETKRAAAKALLSILGFGLILSALGLLCAVLAGSKILAITFDSSFSAAGSYLILQVGVFGLQYMSWTLGSFFIIKGNPKEFIVLEVISQIICFSIGWCLIPLFGVLGIYAAFIGEGILYCIYLSVRLYPYFQALFLKERVAQ